MLGKRTKRQNGAGAEAEIREGGDPQVSVIAKGMRVLGDCVTDGAVRST